MECQNHVVLTHLKHLKCSTLNQHVALARVLTVLARAIGLKRLNWRDRNNNRGHEAGNS